MSCSPGSFLRLQLTGHLQQLEGVENQRKQRVMWSLWIFFVNKLPNVISPSGSSPVSGWMLNAPLGSCLHFLTWWEAVVFSTSVGHEDCGGPVWLKDGAIPTREQCGIIRQHLIGLFFWTGGLRGEVHLSCFDSSTFLFFWRGDNFLRSWTQASSLHADGNRRKKGDNATSS